MKYQCTRCGRRTLMTRCVRCNVNAQPVDDDDDQTYQTNMVAVNTAIWGFDTGGGCNSSSSDSSDQSSCSSSD